MVTTFRGNVDPLWKPGVVLVSNQKKEKKDRADPKTKQPQSAAFVRNMAKKTPTRQT